MISLRAIPREDADDEGAERPRRFRTPLHQPVQVVAGETRLIAEILDIGEDGLRLRSCKPLDAVGQDVELHVALPQRGPERRFTLHASVIWRAGLLAGLRFCDPVAARPQVAALLRRELTIQT